MRAGRASRGFDGRAAVSPAACPERNMPAHAPDAADAWRGARACGYGSPPTMEASPMQIDPRAIPYTLKFVVGHPVPRA